MDDYDFVNKLKKEVKVPEKVWDRYEQILANIDILSEERKKTKQSAAVWERIGEKIKRRGTAWAAAAALFVVLIVGGGAICYSNPVLASKFPMVGTIFRHIEDRISFSGVYSDFNQISVDGLEKAAGETIKGKEYSVTSNGITITASEIYCDGFSVYLTAKIESEEGGFEHIASFYTQGNEKVTANQIYAFSRKGSYQIGEEDENRLWNHRFQGNVIDDHTFIGMIKFDRNTYSTESGNITLKFRKLAYDYTEDGKIDHRVRVKGNWSFTIPYVVDQEHTKEIFVDRENESGYGIEKVVVTPYQVVLFTKTSRITGSSHVEYAVFTQDGENLDRQNDDSANEHVFICAVNGKKIKKLRIYVGGENRDCEESLYDVEQEKKAEKLADFVIQVPVE